MNKSGNTSPLKENKKKNGEIIKETRNPEYTHLKKHPINQVINLANEFIHETFLRPND
jgi:hypothetical protein